MLKKIILVLGFNIICGAVLHAAENSNKSLNFDEEMKKISAACNLEPCVNPYAQIQIHAAASSQNSIEKKLKSILEKVAFKQAQIWADTILEGDYVADGKTHLDKVYALFRNNELIAFKIVYSERAWDTSDCSYDGINSSTLANCTEGRIVETSYVSVDFKEFFIDEKGYAEFK